MKSPKEEMTIKSIWDGEDNDTKGFRLRGNKLNDTDNEGDVNNIKQ